MKSFTFLFFALLLPFTFLAQEVSFSDGSDLLPGGTVSDHAIAVVDMNGDGKDDIVRMNSMETGPGEAEQTVYIAIQQGPGEDFLQTIVGTVAVAGTGSADAWGLCVLDLDENGINDLVTGGFYNGVQLFKANSDATAYTHEIVLNEEIYVQGMSALDINADGSVDIFICDDNDISQILSNDGNGNMSEIPVGLDPATDGPSDNSGNYGTVFSDVDNNGHADLYLSKCRQGVNENTDPRRINMLFMNNGDGTWTSEGVARGVDIGAQSWSADFGDYDNDGDMDLFVGNHDALSDFLVNDGNGNFTEMTSEADLESEFPFLVIQTSWADFNNDGFIDLLAMGNGSHTLALNNGDGTFDIYEELFGNYPVNSYAIGDLDSDGDLDLYITANGYGGWGNEDWEDRIFLNDDNENHWLNVDLTGVESNINGIGARVSIYGPWGVQIRDVKSGESYGIQNSLTQHFGLGAHTTVDQITVSWPSGEVDSFFDIPADQNFEVIEGTGLVSVLESADLLGLKTYPNPSQDVIHVELDIQGLSAGTTLMLELRDTQGRSLWSESVNKDRFTLSLDQFEAGVYLMNLISDGKLIAQHELVKQ